MKKILFLLYIVPALLMAQSPSQDRPLNVSFYYAPFHLPGTDSLYVELYFSVDGSSAKYIKTAYLDKHGKKKTGYIATIGFKILITKNDTIVGVRKYVLNSPVKKDSLEISRNFADVKRFQLKPDKYKLSIEIYDTNSTAEPISYSTDLDFTSFSSDSIFFSGIEFVSNLSKATGEDLKNYPELVKNGLLVVPYVSDFFPSYVKKLSYYLEIYNTGAVLNYEPFLLKVYLENSESLEVLPKYVYYFRKQSAPAIVAASEINIETLPSGKYNLVFEIRDKNNNLKYQKRFLFGRSNPKIDKKLLDTIPDVNIDTTFVARIPSDSLFEYIKYLYPISNPMEISFAQTQIKAGDIKMMRNYFYVFWVRRNGKNPEKEWKNYLSQVKYVNERFSTQIKKGYETDRGRVYLQYGSPDDVISEEHDPGLVPYEIWYYYHIKGQNNVKFVFYNPDLNYNGYVLLHSTAKGEVYLPNWKAHLDKRFNNMYDPYNNNVEDYMGRHLDRDIMQDKNDRQYNRNGR